MSKRLGLIIGANHYKDPMFPSLQYAENDARALAQWLVNTRGGKWSPSDVQHVQGNHATKSLVESLTTQMCMNIAEPGDLVFIYFGGYAYVDESTGEGYLALSDTDYHNPSTGLHLNSFAQHALARSRASHILLIFDCFQKGQAWNMRRSSPFDSKPLFGPTLLNTLQQVSNRLFLCSCRGNESIPEVGEKSLGTFVYRMIIGLSGQAQDSTTGTVTLRQLHSYLFANLGEQHRPQLFGQEQPPMILVGDAPSKPTSLKQFSSFAKGSPTAPPSTPNTAYEQPLPAQENPQSTVMTAPPQQTVADQSTPSATDQHFQQQRAMMLAQAQQLLQAQQYPNAFNVVEQVLQVMPNDIEALILKGQILGTGGRFQEAMAVVEQLLQLDPNNVTVWNMRAVLFNNMGQHQAAMAAIEHSLELDANNPNTYGIKKNIMSTIGMTQSQAGMQSNMYNQPAPGISPQMKMRGFFIAFALQVLGFILGIVGAGLPVIQPHLPSIIGLFLMSLGLTALCANAARGTHRYGIACIIPTLLMSLVAGIVLGALYKFGITKIIAEVKNNPQLLVPSLFLGIWLILAALLPPIFAIGGLISSAIARRRR